MQLLRMLYIRIIFDFYVLCLILKKYLITLFQALLCQNRNIYIPCTCFPGNCRNRRYVKYVILYVLIYIDLHFLYPSFGFNWPKVFMLELNSEWGLGGDLLSIKFENLRVELLFLFSMF